MIVADYKRMVSYMYQYENGVKKKNVGFARIEAKDGQCRITLHMQLLGQLDSIFPTYIMQRKHSDLELIYLGDTQLKNQVMDSRLVAEESNIMDSGYSLSDMGGLLLFLNDKIFFATEWDDKPVIAKEVLDALKPKDEKEPLADPIPEVNVTSQVIAEQGITSKYLTDLEPAITLEEELLIPKYMLPRGYKTIERLQRPVDYIRVSYPRDPGVKDTLETMSQAEKEEAVTEKLTADQDITADEELTTEEQFAEAEKMVVDEELKTEEAYAEDREFAADGEEEVLRQSELREQKNEEEKPIEEAADPQVVKNIFEKYPRIYPFEDNEILICAKIEPKDIGLLPKELWALSNNSFLVHGYYCYHHLIFAKLKDRYGCRYILGIPGIYHNREKFMAKMFGFDGFKPIRKRELRQGDFGYWYMTVCF